MKKDINLQSIEGFIKNKLGKALEVNPASINSNEPLTNYGLDSMSAIVMVGDLEEWLEVELPNTLLWDYPTVTALTSHLYEEVLQLSR